jgi:hypothetical protein
MPVLDVFLAGKIETSHILPFLRLISSFLRLISYQTHVQKTADVKNSGRSRVNSGHEEQQTQSSTQS